MIRYNETSIVNQLKNDLYKNFPERPSFVVDGSKIDYKSLVNSYYNLGSGFFFIENFDKILANPEIYNGLNQRRDKLASYPIAIIALISPTTEDLFIRQIMEKMPDMWAYRSMLIDLRIQDYHKIEANRSFKITNWENSSVLGGSTMKEKINEINRLLKRIGSSPQGNKKHITSVYEQVARLYTEVGSYKKAIEYYLKLEKLYLEFHDNAKLGTIYNDLGIIYSFLKDYTESEQYYKKSEELRINIGDDSALGTTYNNLGGFYNEIGEWDKALQCFLKAEQLLVNSNYKNGLGAVYNNIGGFYIHNQNWDQALHYFLKSETLRLSIGDTQGLAITYFNLGVVYYNLNELSRALECYMKSGKILIEINDFSGLRNLYIRLIELYFALQDYKKVIEYSIAIRDIELKFPNLVKLGIINFYIGSAYSYLGESAKAFEYYFKSEKECHELGDEEGVTRALYHIGLEYLKKPETVGKAVDYFTLAGYIAFKSGLKNQLSQMDYMLKPIIDKNGKEHFMRQGEIFYESWVKHF